MIEFKRKYRPRSAYTLVEVLIVVAIIGIAGAIIVPNMLTAGTLGIQAAARMVIADILIAQNEAIAQQATRKVIFDSGNNNYRLTDGANATIAAPWRVGNVAANYMVDFDTDQRFGGVRIENVNFGGASELVFDALGAPLAGGQLELSYVGGGENRRFRIQVGEFTGKVTVQEIDGG